MPETPVLPSRPPRPISAVTHGVGLAGLAGSLAWIAIARWQHLDGPYAALVHLLAVGLPMILWSLMVDKVHRHPSTGIDWAHPRPARETLDISLTKLVGLWATFAVIGIIYATGRFYWRGNFAFAMWCFEWIAPALFLLSIPYVLWLDRRLVAPKDGAWMLGAWLAGQKGIEAEAIYAEVWQQKPEDVAKFFPKYYTMPGEWSPGDFNRPGLDRMSAGLQLIGEVDKPVDWKSVIDQRFLPKDLQRPL